MERRVEVLRSAHGALLVGIAFVACGNREPTPSSSLIASGAPSTARDAAVEDDHERELAALLAFEDQRRAAIDFATLPPSDAVMGPDPYRLAALPDGLYAGILRGESAVVVLDRDGKERSRIAGPRSPSGLAIAPSGEIDVVGDGARDVARYRWDGTSLTRVGSLAIDTLGMRAIAHAPDGATTYVVEEHEGRLLAATAKGTRELGRCHGPVQVESVSPGGTSPQAGARSSQPYIVTNCLLDHAIEIRRPPGPGVARIHHDGPLWGFALANEADGGLLIAATGIEDHPLVREDGGFGYIDSFVYLYRLAPDAPAPIRLAAVNASALGVVTPKWIALAHDDRGTVVTTAGYASNKLVTLTWPHDGFTRSPAIAETELPPGTAAAVRTSAGDVLAANPLLDAWIVRRDGDTQIVDIATTQPARSMQSRVGEALFFTNMMAPWNSSEGKLSRFTCEACHFEGYVDGRVHFTGRANADGKVHAASRPLFGLFNNRPHFSRALDKTTTQMVHAEFRVANRHNGRDPWFALDHADRPWLARLGAPERLPPELLRESFMTFLGDFSHRANPRAQDHQKLTAAERAGARVFRDRCADCHAARLVADDPKSLVPFERWESLVLSPSGPIVWSNAAYAKTGVRPYVYDDGARVPSLRRLYKKWPYFTNGHARSLSDLLDRYAADGKRVFHDHAPADDAKLAKLSAADKAALLAFLDLL